MSDKDKTKNQLLEEINEYRSEIIELQKLRSKNIQEREKYRRLVDNLQEGIWALDIKDKTTFVNKGMAEMLGKKVFDFMDERGVRICKERLEGRMQGVK